LLKYCPNCGAEVQDLAQNICRSCGTQLNLNKGEKKEKNLSDLIEKFGNRLNMELNVHNIPNFVQPNNQELFEKMAKNFVPLDTSGLSLLTPNNDKIFTSLILRGFNEEKTYLGSGKTQIRKYWWNTPVIITKLGIAYIEDGLLGRFPGFKYWDEINCGRGGGFSIKSTKFYIKSKETKDLYSNEDFTIVLKNLGKFCRILKKNFYTIIKEMNICSNKINSVGEIIDKYGIDWFITNLEIFIDYGEKKVKNKEKSLAKPFRIIENVLKICNSEEKQKILYFLKNNLKRFDINKTAEKLFQKSIKTRLKDREKSLNFCIEAFKLNPYDPKIKKQLVEILRSLGKEDEIKNYVNETL